MIGWGGEGLGEDPGLGTMETWTVGLDGVLKRSPLGCVRMFSLEGV